MLSRKYAFFYEKMLEKYDDTFIYTGWKLIYHFFRYIKLADVSKSLKGKTNGIDVGEDVVKNDTSHFFSVYSSWF
jgi:hypothetical protein